jgi:hypothetical protein
MRYDSITGHAALSHLAKVFFHKYFSRKNRRQLTQDGQDERSEGAGSEECQGSGIISEEDSADGEREADEEGSSEAEEGAVWKVRTPNALGFLFSCESPGYASYHATRKRR